MIELLSPAGTLEKLEYAAQVTLASRQRGQSHALPPVDVSRLQGLREAAGYPPPSCLECPVRGEAAVKAADGQVVLSRDELVQLLAEFETVVKQAGAEYNVSLIANYVYDLAKEYNQFYHDFPMLREENGDLRNFRLLLSKNVALTIKKGMSLFGIDVPERM